jgi:hypothetical protein
VGSPVAELQAIAISHLAIKKLFQFCIYDYICFEAQWTPREEHLLADYLSRIVDSDDRMLFSVSFHPDGVPVVGQLFNRRLVVLHSLCRILCICLEKWTCL